MTEGVPEPPQPDASLVERLLNFSRHDEPIATILRADEKVIARVTDGIYRQPGSALRELISNAYDADATIVRIQTDRPRFGRIVVDDDGNGMSPATLVHMVHHIGGSAKRSQSGIALGVTRNDDPTLSPAGRKLIGKIGIGLFSVAQLTQSFEIITKVKDDRFRTVAHVVLRRFSDDVQPLGDTESSYEAGKVSVWREPATDVGSHGTTVILNSIWPQTIETLRSESRWDPVRHVTKGEHSAAPRVPAPRYHIGAVSLADDSIFADNGASPQLPWDDNDTPQQAFGRLVLAITNPEPPVPTNPPTTKLLDYYLQMIWELSLWCPLPYADIHPFDLELDGTDRVFALGSNARELPVHDTTNPPSVREALGLGEHVADPNFRILIDDLELSRPIMVRNFPATSSAMQKPLFFGGSASETFDKVDRELSGGPLRFQAYLLWAPQIRPPDHQGVLVRVHNATGMLFDHDFLAFPVAEQRRLSQTTCEIFILEGFDGAINIDRESFNFAHPHAVYLARWLHAALRLVIATQKRLAKEALADRRSREASDADSLAQKLIDELWKQNSDEDGSRPPAVQFSNKGHRAGSDSTAHIFDRQSIFEKFRGPNAGERSTRWEALMGRIAQVLIAYDVLADMSIEDQNSLLRDIRVQIAESGLT